ncbi:MAG: hypothetical protein ACK5V5_13570 [Cyclobacteriaceae bacterium]|nr:hypothetical protein [Flammeovirgaceae bacterium]
MQNKLRFFCLVMASVPSLLFAQTNTLGDREIREQPESAITTHTPRKKNKLLFFKRPKVQHTAVYEYYARVEEAARQKQRMLRKMDRPQFSDPSYFGHRRAPKKHPPHKKRFCRECGIRH